MPNPGEPQILSRKTLFKGKKFDYEQLLIRNPAGREHTREMVRHPGAVVIVPVLPDGRVALIRVFRASVQQMTWECPAGTLEPNEPPMTTAFRELIEETGFEAASMTPIGRFMTSPGLSDEWMHAFLATGLKSVGQRLEEDEAITVHPTDVGRVFQMIDDGEMADGKSLTALLLASRRGLL